VRPNGFIEPEPLRRDCVFLPKPSCGEERDTGKTKANSTITVRLTLGQAATVLYYQVLAVAVPCGLRVVEGCQKSGLELLPFFFTPATVSDEQLNGVPHIGRVTPHRLRCLS
jgi:hypothetical protein